MRRGIFWFTLVKSPTSAHSVTWPLPDKALWLNTLKGDISKLHYLSKQHEFANIFLYHTIEMFTDVFPLCLHLSFVVCTKKTQNTHHCNFICCSLNLLDLMLGNMLAQFVIKFSKLLHVSVAMFWFILEKNRMIVQIATTKQIKEVICNSISRISIHTFRICIVKMENCIYLVQKYWINALFCISCRMIP